MLLPDASLRQKRDGISTLRLRGPLTLALGRPPPPPPSPSRLTVLINTIDRPHMCCLCPTATDDTVKCWTQPHQRLEESMADAEAQLCVCGGGGA